MAGRYSNVSAARAKRVSARKRKKAAYRKRTQNRASMVFVTVAVFIIVAVIAVSAMGLQKKIDTYDARIQELKAEIQKEEQRAKDLEEFRKYTQTKGYVEEIAQEKLGLVYNGEIIFTQE